MDHSLSAAGLGAVFAGVIEAGLHPLANNASLNLGNRANIVNIAFPIGVLVSKLS